MKIIISCEEQRAVYSYCSVLLFSQILFKYKYISNNKYLRYYPINLSSSETYSYPQSEFMRRNKGQYFQSVQDFYLNQVIYSGDNVKLQKLNISFDIQTLSSVRTQVTFHRYQPII